MAEMDKDTASAVIDLAIKHEGYEGEKPEEEAALIVEANELVSMLQTSYAGGSRSDAVKEILSAAKVDADQYPDVYSNGDQPTSPASDAAPAEETKTDNVPENLDHIYPGYDNESAKDIKAAILAAAAEGDLTKEEFDGILAYEEANEERKGILSLQPEFKAKPALKPASSSSAPSEPVGDYSDPRAYAAAYENGTLGDDRIRQEGLSVPEKPEGDEPLLPVDITVESHQTIARLYTYFTNLEARGHRLVSLEEGRASACAHLEHDALRDETARIFGGMEDVDKSKVTHVDSAKKEAKEQAESSEAVKIWRSRKRQHEAEARNLKALVVGWSLKRERCSREQTRREKVAANGS